MLARSLDVLALGPDDQAAREVAEGVVSLVSWATASVHAGIVAKGRRARVRGREARIYGGGLEVTAVDADVATDSPALGCGESVSDAARRERLGSGNPY